MSKYRNTVLAVLAVVVPLVSYLLQVDPLSLCGADSSNKNLLNKGNLPMENSSTTDAGVE